MKVTVVIPTINRWTLQHAIRSVLTQTRPCELVVCSDLERYGTGPTLNRAIEAVRTPYVGFLGDDDRLHSRYVEWFEAENAGADLFLFQMAYEDGGILPGHTTVSALRRSGAGGSFLMRTALARRLRFVTEDVSIGYHEDQMMIELVRDLGHRIQISPRVAYLVRH